MRQRKWTEKELLVAYYVARFGRTGLDADDDELTEIIIPGSTIAGLNMQAANFRYLLNLDGYKLSHTSKLQEKITEEYKNKTTTQIRNELHEFFCSFEEKVESNAVKRNNCECERRKQALNTQYEENFKAKFTQLSKGRRLVRVNKSFQKP